MNDMRSQMPSMPPRGGIPGFPPSGDDSDEEEGQSFFAGGERRSIAFIISSARRLTEIAAGFLFKAPADAILNYLHIHNTYRI